MAGLEPLTQGAIMRMVHGDQAQVGGETQPYQPICQVLTVRKILTKDGPDRFRVILSDGLHFVQAMMSSQTTHLIEDGSLDRNSIVRITGWAPNTVGARRILIILSMEIAGEATKDRIGDPANVEKATAGGEDDAAKTDSAPAEATSMAPVKTEVGAAPPAASSVARPAHAARTRATLPAEMANIPIYPIDGLSPYQNKWMIKARVTTKSEIKHWANARGEGKLFSCNFLDESGEIKATAFNDQVDRLYPMIKEGHVYYLTKAKVNIAKKMFSNLTSEYEISFERETQVAECNDADDVPEIKYNFIALDKLEAVQAKSTCDVIGIVESVGEANEIVSKASQKPVTKRELTMVDQSGMSVRLTLWGKTAENYGTSKGQPGCAPADKPVIAVKGVNVSDFGGRSLSMFSSSTMHINPDIPEAFALRGWYDAEGGRHGNQFKTYNGMSGSGSSGPVGDMRERKVVQQVKDENLGTKEKPDYFNFKGTVLYVKVENLFYPACPKDGCNKKMTMEAENSWRCEKCEMHYPAPQYRYLLQANVQDDTGHIWISGFNDIGEQMIGMTANELNTLKDSGDENALNNAVARANGKSWVFNIRAKQEFFQEVPRIRYTITRMAPVDFVKEGLELAEAIKRIL